MLITDNFLLQSREAEQLYHDYAAAMPIIDYHCHLPPEQIADNYQFRNISDLWLCDDHYKWRVMRTLGIGEEFCTGDAPDKDKFLKLAWAMPQLIRNPVYHWAQLELKRYFGIDELLTPTTAESIWQRCNELLSSPDYSCRGLMKQSNVKLVCTTDDPLSTLDAHTSCAADGSFATAVLPTFRPDPAINIEQGELFNRWVDELAAITGDSIDDYASFLAALEKRVEFFHAHGCRISDHGLEPICGESFSEDEIPAIFANARAEKPLSASEIAKFKSAMLFELGTMYHKRGWTQQYHIGALRACNSRMVERVGHAKGYDSIADRPIAEALSALLDRLNQSEQLPKTILYNLNPSDNEVIATMAGNFQDGETRGKIQMGSGWWFLDQKDGMERQIESLSQLGVLSCFVGMLTDSRSFTSYVRHEYFRRILCNTLGRDMAEGLIPKDMSHIGGIVKDICYNNAVDYFGFDSVAKV